MDTQTAILLGQIGSIALALIALYRTREKRQTIVVESKAHVEEKQANLPGDILNVLGKDVKDNVVDLKNAVVDLTVQLKLIFQQGTEREAREKIAQAAQDAHAQLVVAKFSDDMSDLKRELTKTQQGIVDLLTKANIQPIEPIGPKLDTANAQLTLANTQMTRIIHQNDVAAQPNDTVKADETRDRNTAEDKKAAQ